ncbi:hypothetical protein LCD52_13175 [Rossellomorea vietnamensis]|uniref:hypothetical protein n=1 Tax=Rossellomorea vietnamensis TaxID=218284 RepID=UPI001CCB7E9E|nr:hypothetical protein [Rossellomorea vietnamensis]MCA0149746.1 hypothetical protein [Rossellomorea vietnamensis]
MILPTIIEFIKYLLIAILLTQLGFGCLILLFGRTMVDFYTISIYEKPKSTFQRMSNVIQKTTIGFGFLLYSKVSTFNWLLRKVLLLGCLLVQAFLSIFLYEIIVVVLDWLSF